MKRSNLIFNGPKDGLKKIILAHGAGAPMDSSFMTYFAEGLGERGFSVIRFEFKYMEEIRRSGKKKPPSSIKILTKEWEEILEIIGLNDVIVGGKSMGGRVASVVAAKREDLGYPVSGIICLGYPFHPPGRLDKLRISHLNTLETPTLICQGERDLFGKKQFVETLSLPQTLSIHWLKDGDHSFKPRKDSGVTEEVNFESAIDRIKIFIKEKLS